MGLLYLSIFLLKYIHLIQCTGDVDNGINLNIKDLMDDQTNTHVMIKTPGEKVTLSCELSSLDGMAWDNNIVWGKLPDNLTNNTEDDFEEIFNWIFNESFAYLPVEHVKQELNKAVLEIKLRQTMSESVYFCASMKYKVFEIISFYSLGMPMYGMFECKADSRSIGASKVCDGTNDCSDGSDENAEICREISCDQCASGSCISRKWCCENLLDSCLHIYRISCCYAPFIPDRITYVPEYIPPKIQYEARPYHTNTLRGCKILIFMALIILKLIWYMTYCRRRRAARASLLQEEQPMNREVGVIVVIPGDVLTQQSATNADGEYRRAAGACRNEGVVREDFPPSYTDVMRQAPPPYSDMQNNDCI